MNIMLCGVMEYEDSWGTWYDFEDEWSPNPVMVDGEPWEYFDHGSTRTVFVSPDGSLLLKFDRVERARANRAEWDKWNSLSKNLRSCVAESIWISDDGRFLLCERVRGHTFHEMSAMGHNTSYISVMADLNLTDIHPGQVLFDETTMEPKIVDYAS